MSVISRRQKTLLLNDVARMINNNNHTAFANHAKEAESINNGDLKFYIDSPKKEFVIRYGRKEIRFNCSEQNIKELNEIVFNNNSTIKGISDTVLLPSSTIALSTKGAQQIKQSINEKAEKTHNHDDKYALKEHTHDNNYATKSEVSNKADKLHAHPEYQPVGDYATKSELSNKADKSHSHSNYADKSHSHSSYADKSHTHYGIKDKDELEEFIKEISEHWWDHPIFKGLEWGATVANTGYIAGLHAQIKAIHAALVADGIKDGIVNTSTIGTTLTGFADKFQDAADVVKKIGDACDSLSEPLNKIVEPINKVSEGLDKVSKTLGNFSKCENFDDYLEIFRRAQNGAPMDIPLAKPTDLLSAGLLD